MLVVIEAMVKDREKFAAYVRGHLPTIEAHGGRVVARSTAPTVVEGDWRPAILVVHEWPDEAAFRRWWDSQEYAPWKAMRGDACDLRIVAAT